MDGLAGNHILVAADASPSSEAAVGVALHLADGGRVVFAHTINRAALSGGVGEPFAGAATSALRLLERDEAELFEREMKRAGDAGVQATTLSLDGVSYGQIVRAARKLQVDMIVMGTRGLHGLERLFVGSTAEGVLRRSSVPTIVVREGGSLGDGPLRCILVAIDESDVSRKAAYWAVDLAARQRARVVFAHVAEQDDDAIDVVLRYAQEYALESGVRNETAILHGSDVPKAIRAGAKQCHADAIALGTHGTRGIERLLLGSVAEAVVRESSIPVIVVPPAVAGTR